MAADDSQSKRPRGAITTLLDLTDRDAQENDIFPLQANQTWFTRDRTRKTIPFTPQLQTILFRGSAAFGQRFSFDLGALNVGDLLFGAALEIKLNHWLDAEIQQGLQKGVYQYADPQTAWEYANSLGTQIIAKAELEIDGITVEEIDGDFIQMFSLLYSDLNTQFGVGYDHLGRLPIPLLRQVAAPQGAPPRTVPLLNPAPRLFPTEDATIHCPLPFFFGRIRNQEALPLIAIREGLVRIHITLRPFTECVRQIRGYRDSCDDTPLGTAVTFNVTGGSPFIRTTSATQPDLNSVALLTHSALIDGELRKGMLRRPFEVLHRELQTFYFDEPLKYIVNKTASSDRITIQLPLEANHPVEEILWFIRRKGTSINNEYTNWSDKLEQEWQLQLTDPIGLAPTFLSRPMIVSAKLQVNGVVLVEAEEQYFRQHIAAKHKGGYVAFANWVYGYSFAERLGEHQPTGSINASRANSLRLTLEVKPPGGVLDNSWEVKVFCGALNWMRFENGLANAVFED